MTYTVRHIDSGQVVVKIKSIHGALGFAYGWNHALALRSDDPVEVVDEFLMGGLLGQSAASMIDSTDEPERG